MTDVLPGATTGTTAIHLRAGFRTDPLGIPAAHGVQLSWSVSGDGTVDRGRGFDVVVARTAAEIADPTASTWSARGVDTTWTRDDEQIGARESRAWRVSAWLTDGTRIESEVGRFEIGLLAEQDWRGDWIAAPLLEHRRETWDPAPLLRSEFTVSQVPAVARCYATALGLYRLWINGTEVTEDSLFRPGWTDYRFRVLHQSYDVTGLLRPGTNTVAVTLAKGWFAGRLGLQREIEYYGERPHFRLQIEDVAAPDAPIATTDGSWRFGYGAILGTDLLYGETQDVRREPVGWKLNGFDDSAWSGVEVGTASVPISPQPHDPVQRYREIEGVMVREHARGPVVFDFGQNVVGWTRVESSTLPKADVIVRHGEILTKDDLIWRDNLRGAFQEDRYTTGDANRHSLETAFTLHGFRYAEVWGLPSKIPHGSFEKLDDSTVTAVVVSGGQRPVGRFECSDDRLTRLASAVEWTVRDNFIEVITDCPQREERLGWLGDAGVISQTAAYHFDIAAFVRKFVQDAVDSQGEDGTIRNYVPPVPPSTFADGAPGWADGYVRLVHLAATRYGDLVTAAENYEPIARYLDFVDSNNPSGIRTERVGTDFSDWLSLPEDPSEKPHPLLAYTEAYSTSSKRVVATAHSIRSFDQAAELAALLGHGDDAKRYASRAEELRRAYRAEFIDENGRIEGDTQTVYAQAIGYAIVTGDELSAVASRLADKVREQGHVTTGIHGVEHILPALARNGYADLAAELLFRDDMPSWIHMINSGATTIWEKWNGIAPDGTLATAEMNSFNHCALGSVGEFLFETVAGLNARDTALTGTVRVDPLYVDELDWARAEYNSPSGPISSSWKREGSDVVHQLDIPPALTAHVIVPEGFSADSAFDRTADGSLVVGAGQHTLRLRRG